MTTKKNAEVKRGSVRFEPETNSIAYVDAGSSDKAFAPQFVAIVLDESYRGARLAIKANAKIKEEGLIRVQIGQMAPLIAQVRWRKDHTPKLIEIGVKFLE